MNADDRLDQTRVLAALGEIAKAAPDLVPVHHCDGAELDYEVPDRAAAARITRLLGGIRELSGTPAYETGWAGSIADCPVRILVSTRARRGQVWAA